jgi:glycosyltransferase involved in cell wall biosynthesis
MRIAFHAPMKPTDHPVPSGDRRMARLLVAALKRAGHHVTIASRLRAWTADPARAPAIAARGDSLARRLISEYRKLPQDARPQLWFTYHLYHKAPDYLGPAIADALRIPYVVAEASVAPRHRDGPWAVPYARALAAIRRANAVIALSSDDIAGLEGALGGRDRLVEMKPFLDVTPFVVASEARDAHRAQLAARLGIDPARPWLLTVGMFRHGDKLRSYELLGAALRRIIRRDWHLVVVGDGPAEPEVAVALADLPVAWVGRVLAEALPPVLAACDVMVWPAMREAYGMALLEGQAAGLPVVAGRAGGVPDIVGDGVTGFVVAPPDDPQFVPRFADAIARLLDEAPRRQAMGAAARAEVLRTHELVGAARVLDLAIARACAQCRQ